jgi:hypothetical protein
MKVDIRRPELMDKGLKLECTDGSIYGTWEGAIVLVLTLSEADTKTLYKPSEVLGADALFDQFWKLYPRKVGKGAARKAFAKLPRVAKNAALAAMPNFAMMWEWELKNKGDIKFCPHPTVWLNQERWEDEPWEEPMVSSKGKGAYGNGR